jgi:hypothetical protein
MKDFELIECLNNFERAQSINLKRKNFEELDSESKKIRTETFIDSFWEIESLMTESHNLFKLIKVDSKIKDYSRVIKKIISSQNEICKNLSECLSDLVDFDSNLDV